GRVPAMEAGPPFFCPASPTTNNKAPLVHPAGLFNQGETRHQEALCKGPGQSSNWIPQRDLSKECLTKRQDCRFARRRRPKGEGQGWPECQNGRTAVLHAGGA